MAVLKVGVHGYYHIALGALETAVECRRLAVVAAELDAVYVAVLCAQFLNYLP